MVFPISKYLQRYNVFKFTGSQLDLLISQLAPGYAWSAYSYISAHGSCSTLRCQKYGLVKCLFLCIYNVVYCYVMYTLSKTNIVYTVNTVYIHGHTLISFTFIPQDGEIVKCDPTA